MPGMPTQAAFYGDIAEPDVSSAGALGGFYLHIHRVGLGDRFPVEFDGEPRVYAAVIIVETVIQRIDELPSDRRKTRGPS